MISKTHFPSQLSELQPVINKMTNHERNQWARAGYPTDYKFQNIFAIAAYRRFTNSRMSFRELLRTVK